MGEISSLIVDALTCASKYLYLVLLLVALSITWSTIEFHFFLLKKDLCFQCSLLCH